MVTLTWSDHAGDVVRETAASPIVPLAAIWFSPRISTVASMRPLKPVCGSCRCSGAIPPTTSSRSMMPADWCCIRSAAPTRRGGQSPAEWTWSWRRVGRPAGTSGADGNASVGAGRRGRGGAGAGDRRRRDRGRSRRGRGARARRASGVARYPVSDGPGDAHPRGVSPSSDRRGGDRCAVVPRPVRGRMAGFTPPRPAQLDGRDVGGRGPAPLGSRPGEGEVIAHFASGEAIVRYEPAPPMVGTTGDIEALSQWAGQSVALPGSHNPRRRSWPNSSPACNRSRATAGWLPVCIRCRSVPEENARCSVLDEAADLGNSGWKVQLAENGCFEGASALLKIWSTG